MKTKGPVTIAVEALRQEVVGRVALQKVQRLMGYWVLVHAYGSWQAVASEAGLAESTVARQRREFFETFGVHAEDMTLIMPKGAVAEKEEPADVVPIRKARRG